MGEKLPLDLSLFKRMKEAREKVDGAEVIQEHMRCHCKWHFLDEGFGSAKGDETCKETLLRSQSKKIPSKSMTGTFCLNEYVEHFTIPLTARIPRNFDCFRTVTLISAQTAGLSGT